MTNHDNAAALCPVCQEPIQLGAVNTYRRESTKFITFRCSRCGAKTRVEVLIEEQPAAEDSREWERVQQ